MEHLNDTEAEKIAYFDRLAIGISRYGISYPGENSLAGLNNAELEHILHRVATRSEFYDHWKPANSKDRQWSLGGVPFDTFKQTPTDKTLFEAEIEQAKVNLRRLEQIQAYMTPHK